MISPVIIDPNLSNIMNLSDTDAKAKGVDTRQKKQLIKKVALVPVEYMIKVPKLVWDSRNVTWHGQQLNTVIRSLKENLSDGLYEISIFNSIELIASGYYSEFWDAYLEIFFLQGIGIIDSSLYLFVLTEYNFLHSLRNRINRYQNASDLINSQVLRNHLSELITIFVITEHRPLSNELLHDGADLIMEPINDDGSRSLANEYILMTKTESSASLQLEELHYNLAKLFESINMLPRNKNMAMDRINYDQIFFWIYEVVKMTDIVLKPTLQNYLPRQREEWTTHPSNIIWNYLFIRTPNKLWSILGTLMDHFTVNFKRKRLMTCSAILQNLILLLDETKGPERSVRNKNNYIRSRNPLVIQNALAVNELIASRTYCSG